MLLVGRRQERHIGPEFGTQVSVGTPERVKERLDKVSHGPGVSTGTSVTIGDSGHVQ